ncbi:MAG: GNAT family N-acetyltransferase [Synechococcales bacterium]|nr:GNAT family N-acetyltransferase [Synechococcales bacterium]
MEFQILDSFDPQWLAVLQDLQYDIYHLPSYGQLEAQRTQTTAKAVYIHEGDRKFFVPYLLRNCLDIAESTEPIFDAVSPYGYPGVLLSEAAKQDDTFLDRALDTLKQGFQTHRICSVFLRLNPILNGDFPDIQRSDVFTVSGETVSVDLSLSEAELWTHTRSGHRSTINKCKRLGFVPRFVPIADYLDEFTTIYEETMARVSATQSYYSFNREYFYSMYEALGDQLHLCIVELEGEAACAGLYTESCGIVQSTLGGTKDKFVSQSPSTLETDFARYWAKARGNQLLHLGGGVGGSHDSVYRFKAGFSRLSHRFLTLRMITDPDLYHHLVQHRARSLKIEPEALSQSQFFPAYRASA